MPQPDADLVPPQRELDLRTLIRLVWAMRMPLFIAFLLVTIGYWGYWLVSRDAPEAPTYGRVVQFGFDGVEQRRYPNGSPFHIGDLVTPKLISALYDTHGLAERGVAKAAFANAFAIERYSPEYPFIIKRHEQLAETATTAAAVVLQEQLAAELRHAGSRAALLSFRPLSSVPLEQGDIGKLLLDLPKLWARQAVEDYGVLGLDSPVYSPALFDEEKIGELEYVVALDSIQRKVSVLLNGVRAGMQMPHANLVRDPQSGATLLDVREIVGDLMAQEVQRLRADVVQLGLAKDRPALIRDYEHRVGELAAASDVAATRVATLQRVLMGRGGPRQGAGLADGQAATMEEPSPIGTLAAELLARGDEAARLSLELAAKRTVLDALKRRGDREEQPPSPPVEVRLTEVVSTLKGQVAVVQRIHALLSRDNFAAGGGLYHIADGGLVISRPEAWRPSDVYIYVLLLFAVATAVVIVGNAFGTGQSDRAS